MRRILILVLCLIWFCPTLAVAEEVDSNTLIEQAMAYDGREVVFTGEVIGDVLNAGDHDQQTLKQRRVARNFGKHLRAGGAKRSATRAYPQPGTAPEHQMQGPGRVAVVRVGHRRGDHFAFQPAFFGNANQRQRRALR